MCSYMVFQSLLHVCTLLRVYITVKSLRVIVSIRAIVMVYVAMVVLILIAKITWHAVHMAHLAGSLPPGTCTWIDMSCL